MVPVMSNVVLVLLGLALLAVAAVLLLGLFSLAKGGAFAEKYGNKLMRARIVAQLVAVLLFVLAYLLRS